MRHEHRTALIELMEGVEDVPGPVLIDHARLQLHPPEIVNDLPAGGKRLVQRADGYRMTLVAGTPVFEAGEHTGALPGRLVRRGAL